MTQEAIQISETPPLPGLKLVQDLNKALQTIATDFAGPTDPAALAGPFMTWADTGNMLLKRRNAANTAWVVEGELFTYKANRNGDAGEKFKASPATESGDVVTFEQAFGVGQSWQSPTRETDTMYTNTTGKPIFVNYSADLNAGETSYIGIRVDGVRWGGLTRGIASNVTGAGVCCIIPPGSTYEYRAAGATNAIVWEYR